MIGKSVVTFGPLEPALVTTEEIPDPHGLEFSLAVNGVERQHANTRNQVFSILFLIAGLSAVMTLEPGDVLATGTPGSPDRRLRRFSAGRRHPDNHEKNRGIIQSGDCGRAGSSGIIGQQERKTSWRDFSVWK
jgi:2-keto-4-pentenoate hydratase/2-oxohepta-3-ene-1,7-dioic acid hydratase in catechol pathway